MNYKVSIHKKNEIIELNADKDTNLLDFLRKNSLDTSAPCGGKGTCGKCRVRVSGIAEAPSKKEAGLLGEKLLESGYRLACHNSINSDIVIFIEDEGSEAKIATEGVSRNIKLFPSIKKEYVELPVPDINDQRSDIERISEVLKIKKPIDSISLIRNLPGTLRSSGFKVTLGMVDGEPVFIEPGDTAKTVYGIAVDIGTTTIAAYLYDLVTGEKAATYSVLNPQKKFGADVLSRIDYTISSDGALKEMQESIVGCINEIAEKLAAKGKISLDNIYAAVFVGNTTMVHFLLGISAGSIAVAPFIPVTTQLHRFEASNIGIRINPNGIAVIFPSVSAYIGADTVAAVLSSGMYTRENISLLIDIGTNGEIALGNNGWIYSCSTAAGPAFEGANIRNGVGGISGAIDSVNIGDDVEITVIGNTKPVGICGSGIIDAVARMLGSGIIDETGRIFSEDDDEFELLPQKLKERIAEVDGMRAFIIKNGEPGGYDIDIAITQKDIREIQNAKAAIAAGIRVLVNHAGIKMEDVQNVYLAGGFGSYISVDSALQIGLIPGELKGKVKSIGNAAGAGAIEGLLSSNSVKDAAEIKNKIQYVELSARPDFVDEYVECMMFE